MVGRDGIDFLAKKTALQNMLLEANTSVGVTSPPTLLRLGQSSLTRGLVLLLIRISAYIHAITHKFRSIQLIYSGGVSLGVPMTLPWFDLFYVFSGVTESDVQRLYSCIR